MNRQTDRQEAASLPAVFTSYVFLEPQKQAWWFVALSTNFSESIYTMTTWSDCTAHVHRWQSTLHYTPSETWTLQRHCNKLSAALMLTVSHYQSHRGINHGSHISSCIYFLYLFFTDLLSIYSDVKYMTIVLVPNCTWTSSFNFKWSVCRTCWHRRRL